MSWPFMGGISLYRTSSAAKLENPCTGTSWLVFLFLCCGLAREFFLSRMSPFLLELCFSFSTAACSSTSRAGTWTEHRFP